VEAKQTAFDLDCLPKTIGDREINRAQHSDPSQRLSIVDGVPSEKRCSYRLILAQGLL
jgi:hypothetical protein